MPQEVHQGEQKQFASILAYPFPQIYVSELWQWFSIVEPFVILLCVGR
jgi:hypothetical protein